MKKYLLWKGVGMHFQRNSDTAALLCAARINGLVVEFCINMLALCVH